MSGTFILHPHKTKTFRKVSGLFLHPAGSRGTAVSRQQSPESCDSEASSWEGSHVPMNTEETLVAPLGRAEPQKLSARLQWACRGAVWLPGQCKKENQIICKKPHNTKFRRNPNIHKSRSPDRDTGLVYTANMKQRGEWAMPAHFLLICSQCSVQNLYTFLGSTRKVGVKINQIMDAIKYTTCWWLPCASKWSGSGRTGWIHS